MDEKQVIVLEKLKIRDCFTLLTGTFFRLKNLISFERHDSLYLREQDVKFGCRSIVFKLDLSRKGSKPKITWLIVERLETCSHQTERVNYKRQQAAMAILEALMKLMQNR